MRRDEFEVADLKEAEQFLREMTFGFLERFGRTAIRR